MIRELTCSLFIGLYSVASNMTGYSHSCHSIKVIHYDAPQRDVLNIKEVLLLAILTRNISSNFSPQFLSICEYNSGKKLHVTDPLKNRHFVWTCTEKNMDRQYKENGMRNIYSNYNQMRAYVE